MSVVAIRTALSDALAGISPALDTAYPNIKYTPLVGTPYQTFNVLFAQPDNSEIGPHYVEQGYMEVSLRYPLNTGPDAIDARADLMRAAFPWGATFVSGSATVIVTKTPEVTPAQTMEDRYIVHVRVRFQSEVASDEAGAGERVTTSGAQRVLTSGQQRVLTS